MLRFLYITRRANGWTIDYKQGGDDPVTMVFPDTDKPAFLRKIAHLLGADFLPDEQSL